MLFRSPLAAVLWNGGISFGGVVAFIFADLIIIPILIIYRKYYGTRMMLTILAIFYAAMVLAGYAVEFLFGGLGLIPAERSAKVTDTGIQWNYTTILNIYRKYYGWRMAAFVTGTFYVTMVIAGYAVELLFKLLHLVPTERNASVIEAHISWNYTTWLDLVFLLLAAVLVVRFVTTGGVAMLKMMGGSPDGERT